MRTDRPSRTLSACERIEAVHPRAHRDPPSSPCDGQRRPPATPAGGTNPPCCKSGRPLVDLGVPLEMRASGRDHALVQDPALVLLRDRTGERHSQPRAKGTSRDTELGGEIVGSHSDSIEDKTSTTQRDRAIRWLLSPLQRRAGLWRGLEDLPLHTRTRRRAGTWTCS